MKQRQKRIYSALIDPASWMPKVGAVSVPSGPESMADQGITAPASRAPAVAALRATAAGGSQGEAPSAALRAAAAAIRLSRASHDSGEVSVEEDGYRLLALHNEAEKYGIIGDISGLPSEGISSFEPPPLPFTLPPQGSWIIIVRHAADEAGKNNTSPPR